MRLLQTNRLKSSLTMLLSFVLILFVLIFVAGFTLAAALNAPGRKAVWESAAMHAGFTALQEDAQAEWLKNVSGYPVQIRFASGCVEVSVPIQNPQAKYAGVFWKATDSPWVDSQRNAGALQAGHDFGAEVVVETNDLLFLSAWLAPDVKIWLRKACMELPKGAFLLKNDCIRLVFPISMQAANPRNSIEICTRVLTGIKKDMNR